ncbi:ATP-dependent helicase Lhr domain protein [Mycobacterium kansasii 732]|nr:ATP-dependent helicase Lhr domain protein [Mycobacterium kansasii 732]
MTLALPPNQPAEIELTDTHRVILDTLAGGGAYFFRQLTGNAHPETALKAALWELIWAGWVTGDTFAPVRAVLGGVPGPASGRPPRTAGTGRRG